MALGLMVRSHRERGMGENLSFAAAGNAGGDLAGTRNNRVELS